MTNFLLALKVQIHFSPVTFKNTSIIQTSIKTTNAIPSTIARVKFLIRRAYGIWDLSDFSYFFNGIFSELSTPSTIGVPEPSSERNKPGSERPGERFGSFHRIVSHLLVHGSHGGHMCVDNCVSGSYTPRVEVCVGLHGKRTTTGNHNGVYSIAVHRVLRVKFFGVDIFLRGKLLVEIFENPCEKSEISKISL